MGRSLQRAGGILAGLTLVSMGLPDAVAQGATTAPPGQPTVEQVTVTAQRRREALIDVPVAVTAFSSAALEARDISNLEGIAGLVPNVKIYNPSGYGTSLQIAVRGGVTINPAPYWEPTTGVYVDGVFISKSEGSVFDLTDLDHVEVLRGPQGTLYGRNTLAGAVNLVSKPPSGEFDGSVKVGIGDYGDQLARVVVDLPKLGPFSLKLSGSEEGRDGTVKVLENPFQDIFGTAPPTVGRLDSINRRAGRVAARLEPWDGVTLDYVLDFSRSVQTPGFAQLTRAPGAIWDPNSPMYFGFPLRRYIQTDPGSQTAYVNGALFNRRIFETAQVRGQSFTAAWDLGPVTLKSITAYRQLEYQNSLDLDGSPLPVAGTQLYSSYHAFSQELQATGQWDRFHYTAGLYYFSDGGPTNNPQSYFAGGALFDSRYAFTSNAYAAYGQVEYVPPVLDDRLTLTAGLRYSNEDKTTDRFEALSQAGGPFFTVIPDTRASRSFDATTPLFIAKYKLGEAANIYAKYAEGFKSGGFNGEASSAQEAIVPFQAETVDEYEIGGKARFLNGRLQVNAAAFWDQHQNMQLSIFTGQGAAASVIRNAGSADVRGLELEVAAIPLDWLQVRGTLGYLDPKYNRFIDGGVNVAHDRAFAYAPPLTGSLSLDATLMENDFAALHLLVDYTHSDPYYAFPYSLNPNAPYPADSTKAGGQDTIDARVNLTDITVPGGKLEWGFWVKNLFNERYRTNGIDFGPGFGNLTVSYYNEPRTFGTELTYRW